MQNFPITRAPSTLPPPPNLEEAKEVPAGKTLPGPFCCLIGSFCGLAASLPSLLTPLAAVAPMAVIGSVATVFYKSEVDKRIAEREVTQQYLKTIHQYLKNQPKLSSSRVQTTRQQTPSEPANV